MLLLKLKPSFKSRKGRELDPSCFSPEEWDAFSKADAKQWEKHLNLGAVEIVYPDEARQILATKPETVLQVPARFVRTNANDDPEELSAKSRLVLPGHLLSKGVAAGEARTDSPTAGLMAFHVLLAVASHFGWHLDNFDVEAAFLTGQKMQREVYFKPPKTGLPGLPPDCLIRAVKGLFGVPEAPRLWWLELISVALKCGWKRVKAFPCVLVVYAGERLAGMLVVHVDDGLLTGDDGPVYPRARDTLYQKAEAQAVAARQVRLPEAARGATSRRIHHGGLRAVREPHQAHSRAAESTTTS